MKHNSDIFICKRKKDDYWAYPSPFVAHGAGFGDPVPQPDGRRDRDRSRKRAGAAGTALSLGPRATDSVIVNGDASPGLFVYEAEVEPRTARSPVSRLAKKRRKPGAIFVKGGSPPEIIIDT